MVNSNQNTADKDIQEIIKRFSAVWADKKGDEEKLGLAKRLVRCNDSIKFFGDLYTAYAYAVDMLKGMEDTEAFIHDYIRVFCPEARNNFYGEEYSK